jgi:hypothetical protein
LRQRNSNIDGPDLVEGHADLLVLAPDDVTGNARTISPEEKIETLGDIEGVADFQRRSRNGYVSDQAVYRATSELNRSRHQYGLARTSALFHENLIR